MRANEDDVRASAQAADRALFGLELVEPAGGAGDLEASFTLTGALARHDGRLYGGTAIGIATALAEAATDRPARWVTVQYIDGSTTIGDQLTCRVEVLAGGRRTSQVRVRAHRGDDEIFCGLAAVAEPKVDSIAGTFVEMPDVAPPEESLPYDPPLSRQLRESAKAKGIFERTMEHRAAHAPGEPPRTFGPIGFWSRVPGRIASPTVIAYLADMVPMMIVHAAGRAGAGTSLDNTMRFGEPADDEWVLLHVLPEQAVAGFGHGSVHVWSRDGRLLGTGSQTSSLMLFD